jgi:outer membrane protein OmpA-like peptidoglycan-associated protein
MRRRGMWLATAALLLAPASASLAQSARLNLPSPRVVQFTERVVTLTPRVVSVAPQRTAPNTFRVGADILFAFDSSTLSPDAQAVLGGVVTQLQSKHSGTVTILGYTDSIGTAAYNLRLSQRRAAAVQAYLQAKASGLTYHAKGLGEADPVAPNKLPDGSDNPAGRQKNRRVIISYAS